MSKIKLTHPMDFAKNLILYWGKDYSGNPIHCTHLTETEKEIKQLRKKLRKVKRESTKEKYKNKIKELQNENSSDT